MNRTDTGTDDDDIVVGSLGNDAIDGLDGADYLGGLAGRDSLDGGRGNDTLDGGVGADVLVGGGGNDVILATQGDDRAVGGDGNDRYVINGTAGDRVDITDTNGDGDTLDARGAGTSALIDLRGGQSSFVDGREIRVAGGTEVTLPLDLALLQDLSGSYSGDLPVVRDLLPDFIEEIQAVAPEVRFGVGSFIDKPQSPFGSSGDFEFALDQPLSADGSALIATYDGLTTGSGSDGPEAQLSALLQIAARADEVDWGTGLRVAVLFTDAGYHEAGDFTGVADNNGDGVLDGSPPGTGEDYPSVGQVRAALKDEGIIPVFAVTDGNEATYEALVEDLGGEGAVVPLSADSEDLIEAVTRGLETVTNTVIERAIGGDHDDTIIGNAAANTVRGRGGDDTIYGFKGADDLAGMGGNDSIQGNQGSDTIGGGAGDDLLNGGGGQDSIDGGSGDDMIRGGGLHDTLFGGSGNDTLKGGNGRDTLNGGAGDDLLDGQGKNDTFVFEGSYGNDTIDGFTPSGGSGPRDVLIVEGVESFADFTAGAVEDGNDVLYTDAGNSIRLLDTELADLSASDFVFA